MATETGDWNWLDELEAYRREHKPKSKRTVTCTAHCSKCRTCFHSLAAYDAHRVGKFSEPLDSEDGRRCVHPLDLLNAEGEMRLVALTEKGRCSMYPSNVREPVTIWTMAGYEKFAESFGSSSDE